MSIEVVKTKEQVAKEKEEATKKRLEHTLNVLARVKDLGSDPNTEVFNFDLNKSNSGFSQYEYTETERNELIDFYEKGVLPNIEPNAGEQITGKIVGQTEKSILVDIGCKSYATVEKTKNEIEALLKIVGTDSNEINYGTEVELVITKSNNGSNYVLDGSFIELNRQNSFIDIIDNIDEDSYDADILEWTPAGYKLQIIHEGHKIEAFMPNTLAHINKLPDPLSIVGKTLPVMIESYSEDKGTFIASRKKYLQTLIPKEIKKIKSLDSDGNPNTFKGVVTDTIDFGVFVEFNNCLTTMIHIANLNDETKALLKNKAIKPGDEVEFFIKEVVRERGNYKINAVQEWRETLWDTIKKGQVFEKEVKGMKRFGALIQLDAETMGLVHTSEIEKFGTELEKGDKVFVKVISIQRFEKKIFLSLITEEAYNKVQKAGD